MKLSNGTARFLIALLTLGIGMAALLFSNYAPATCGPAWIDHLDSTCVRAIFSSNTRVRDYTPASKTVTIHTLAIHPEKSRAFQQISITDDPDRIFEATPPTPLDYAIILQQLYDQGYRSVVLTTRMSWDQAPTRETHQAAPEMADDDFDENALSTQALSYKLAQFDRSVMALPVTRGATSQRLPLALQQTFIPIDQVHGDPTPIPIVNQITLPASISGGEQTLVGFYQIEHTPEPTSQIPLLAHWIDPQNDGLIPSIELLTIMSAHNVEIGELHIQCGKQIRLGNFGPVIPIDEYGQTPIPTPDAETLTRKESPAIPAEKLIAHRKESPANASDSSKNTENTETKKAATLPICIIHAIGEQTNITNLLSDERLSQVRVLCETLPTPSDAVHYHKLPLRFEILIILAIAVITCRFITFSPYNRHLAFALSLSLLLILLLVLMEWSHQWFGLTVPNLTILCAWLISSQFFSVSKK